uniref:Uncharacterized protein n=1 Tax=Picocystis salinarum TaxID=88271 RepID=A0A7S3XD11_9CHLO|mmetsp:Transcript_3110/g.19166  ORF Transcript_3110/g.19166 Transcript_3110/m.19166 type:complete len:266 (-) Transcript_3110:93-890(-)
METALCYDSTRRRLRICARETFASDDHIALHVAAELDTKEGHVSARAKLRKRYFPKHLGFHVDVGAEYATDADEIRYGVKGRKKWELSEDGLLSLDFKSKVQFSQMKRKGDACAKLELSQKIFNFTVRETSRVGSKRTFEPNDGRWKRTHAQSQGVRNERRNGRGGRLDVRRNEAKRHALIDGGRSSATRHLAFERDERERQRTFTNARTDRRGRLRCVRVQEDQDLKIKVGLDVLRRNVYAQIRENNWTLSTDMRGSWHVSYDL